MTPRRRQTKTTHRAREHMEPHQEPARAEMETVAPSPCANDCAPWAKGLYKKRRRVCMAGVTSSMGWRAFRCVSACRWSVQYSRPSKQHRAPPRGPRMPRQTQEALGLPWTRRAAARLAHTHSGVVRQPVQRHQDQSAVVPYEGIRAIFQACSAQRWEAIWQCFGTP